MHLTICDGAETMVYIKIKYNNNKALYLWKQIVEISTIFPHLPFGVTIST